MKLFSILLVFAVSMSMHAQLTPIVDSIPMRDGKKLAADIYLSPNPTAATILVQTPYNRLLYRIVGLPLYGFNVSTMPYNIVILDWRCFYGSLSACVASPDRGEDGYDAVEWIAAQSWSDGQVATHGASALGLIQYQTAKEQPPHLVCICPIVAGPQTEYKSYYEGGVYRTEFVTQLDALGYGLSTFILANQYYSPVWQFVESTTNYPGSITVPAFLIGGWYDHNTDDQVEFFNALRTSSPLTVRDEHRLVMGPWTHKSVGLNNQGALSYPGAAGWSDSLARMYFDYHLRTIPNGWNATPYVQYFQMGDDTWQNSPSWPPTGLQNVSLFFHQGNFLDSQSPSNATGNSSYNYDPADPSPTAGGPTLLVTLAEGPVDQAPVVETRNDILIFSTAILGQDVILKGDATATIYVSSDQPDTDFAIRLTDVYPDGRSMLVSDGITRMRFRNGFTTNDTASMVAGTVYPVDIVLPTTAITFKAGHKIRIDITSSNYPRFDNNLNNGGAMYVAGDTNVANNTVYFNSQYPSRINLQVVDFVGSTNQQHLAALNAAVFPNPSNEEATLHFVAEQTDIYTAEIIDVTGRITWIKKDVCSGEQNWILPASISPGTYIVKLSGASGVNVLRFCKF
ncbi:MAG: CocE/NonD family hydrolase [Bacteroidia bacterium]